MTAESTTSGCAATTGPIVFCFDGSDGSTEAMAAGASLVSQTGEAVVLTVWQTIGSQLARAGAFSGFDTTEQPDDDRERDRAREAAERGAAAAHTRGFSVRSRVELAGDDVAATIIQVCDELDARLIVCGRRGRGAIRSAILGSVSRDLIGRSGRPVLVAPESRERG